MKATTMDKVRENKVIRSIFAIVLALALALPTSLAVMLPNEAQAMPQTITGKATITCTDGGILAGGSQPHATFSVEMPDGKTYHGDCMDHGSAVPKDGTYDFTGTWNGSAYDIVISSDYVANSLDEIHPWQAAHYIGVFPCRTQRVTTPPYLPVGWIDLQKVSSNTDITNGNDCYDLTGAEYTIYSNAQCTNEVAKITTNSDGYAKSSELNTGDYWVKETKQAQGYDLDQNVYKVTVQSGKTARVNGNTVSDNPQNDPAEILVGKFDGEYTYNWEENLPQGAASLEGAEFTVTYYDGQYASSEEAGYTDAQNAGEYTRQWVFATDKDGYINLTTTNPVSGDKLYTDSFGTKTFPLGTYIIQETKAPEGYNLNDEIFVRNVTSEGTFEEVDTYNTPEVPDKVKRGDIKFQKMNANSSERMANVPFLITSVSTGEHHVIVTDENGYFDSSNSFNQHSSNTNGNDAALIENEDGTYSIDESKLDNTCGIYFGMNANGESVPAPNDTYGALPYDTYTIEELRCSANQDMQLVNDQFTLTREGYTLDLGSIDDPSANIQTVATDNEDGDKYLLPEEEQTINDRVTFNGLIKGHTYQFESAVVDVDNNNSEITKVTQDFVADKASGFVDIDLGVNTADLKGHNLTVIEKVFENGDLIASHNEDMTDAEQTVKVIGPEIGTTATDATDGDHYFLPSTETVITDRVKYTGLTPGEEYELKGTLMNKETNEPLLINDKEVTSTVRFTPNDTDGYVDVEFKFDTSDLKDGDQTVAFEYLYKDGIEVATHTDINDEGQTVTVGEPPAGDTFDKTGVLTAPAIIAIALILASLAALAGYQYYQRRKGIQ